MFTTTLDECSVPTIFTSTRWKMKQSKEGSSKKLILTTLSVLLPRLVSLHITSGKRISLQPINAKGKW